MTAHAASSARLRLLTAGIFLIGLVLFLRLPQYAEAFLYHWNEPDYVVLRHWYDHVLTAVMMVVGLDLIFRCRRYA